MNRVFHIEDSRVCARACARACKFLWTILPSSHLFLNYREVLVLQGQFEKQNWGSS